jgi:hypothetical protein
MAGDAKERRAPAGRKRNAPSRQARPKGKPSRKPAGKALGKSTGQPGEMPFEERVLFIVRNYFEYGSYRKDAAQAVRTIQGFFPDRSCDECDSAFRRYYQAYEDTVEFVNGHADRYWDFHRTGTKDRELVKWEAAHGKKHGDIPPPLLSFMISFIFFWHHLK